MQIPIFPLQKRSLMLVTVLTLGLAGIGRGQILEDNFSGTGVLNGRQPDTADAGHVTWEDGTGGSNTISGNADNFTNLNNPGFAALPYAGSNFVAGDTYTLSMTYDWNKAVSGNDNTWIGIGFTDGNPGTANAFGPNGNNGEAWEIIFGQDPSTSDPISLTGFVNGFAASTSNGGGIGDDSGVMEIQLAMASDGSGATVNFLAGPDASDLASAGTLTLTTAEVDAISGVGFFGNNNNYGPIDGTITNFTLSVPEPGAYALVLCGLGVLGLGMRLRLQKNLV